MELTEALLTRRSIRKYAPTAVDQATIDRLLKVAIHSPSANNTQPWAFGVIHGVDVLRGYSDRVKRVWVEMMEQDPSLERLRPRVTDPDFNVFYDAPALICIYARTAAGAYATNDCALAVYSMMLAAHDMGLGSCWIGFSRHLFVRPEVSKELGVPDGYQPFSQLALGYPDGELPPATPRNAVELLFSR